MEERYFAIEIYIGIEKGICIPFLPQTMSSFEYLVLLHNVDGLLEYLVLLHNVDGLLEYIVLLHNVDGLLVCFVMCCIN